MEPKQEIQNSYNNNVVSVGDWVITFILLAIPFVNLILVLVWGFGSNTPLSKRNYARAILILMIIGVIMSILFGAAIISTMHGLVQY